MTFFRIIAVYSFLIVVLHCKLHRSNAGIMDKLEEYIREKRLEINSRYRLRYHVAPPVGWMNDPNGFSYYNGEYHLFYQFYPYEAKWGPMHWGHYSSPDLVNWKYRPTALIPEKEMCYSGSAVISENTMVLMYTAHKQTSTRPYYNETQYLAFSDDGINFHKYEENPVLSFTPDGAADFRDPKVWKHGQNWYAVLGSKTPDERGRVLLYRSADLKNWQFMTVLAESNGDFGHVWECPDFFELDGKYVLIVSPQGVNTKGEKGKSSFQSGYIIGTFNYETFEFKPETDFREIDVGHDFYAAQTMEKDGKRYLVAWFAKWGENYAEQEDGWINALTLVREIRLSNDNRLLSTPIQSVTDLRNSKAINKNFITYQKIHLGKSVEINLSGDLGKKIHLLLGGSNGGDQVKLKWNPETGRVVVDRKGNKRQEKWNIARSRSWRIYLDTSSLELFCGEGELVFSSRVYPKGDWQLTNLSPQNLTVEIYVLERSVPL